jgi:tetratricopeptide (TPR) repeat protein
VAGLGWKTSGVVFVTGGFADWLVGALADAGRKKLTELVLGTEQQRALRQAATAALAHTAAELCPSDQQRAGQVAMVVGEVFADPLPAAPLAGYPTLLQALGAGIAAQLAVLDDASLTGTGQSSADVLGVPGTVVAGALAGQLLREIFTRGARGGPLFALASQLNHDVTHLQGQRLEGMLGDVLSRLARLDAARAVAVAPVALAQLPAAVAGFTGRQDELAVLAALLDPVDAGGPVLVSVVAGLAGVGKTSLAIAAAHTAVKSGWYPGGVLFIDLHGYDKPVEPAQALDALLRALGVPAEHIPPTAEERAGLYRSVLARAAVPVLVIADNASSEAQVRPLLPGAGPHTMVVTSRHTLAGLVDVTVLDETASIALLDTVLRAARPDDDRIARDNDAARRLAGVCGGLPLALQITAALLKADPVLSVAELAEELATGSARLDRLAYDDGSGTAAPSVAAAFELSYRRLGEASAQVFRLLPLSPGPDVSTAAAAVLAELPAREVRKVLAGLARAHLAEAAPGLAGRWRMHDLIHLYAARLGEEHAEADGREAARDRLLGYYVDTANTADAHLRALPGMVVPERFTGREDALAWLDAERPGLIAAVTIAANTGRDQAAMLLPLALAEYLNWRRRFDDWLAVAAVSVDAARRLGHGQGAALNNLGIALREVRRFKEAITAHQDAATIYRDTTDRHREGNALNNLGNALQKWRRFEEAITAREDAAAIYRDTGDRHSEAMALNNLGLALQEMGRFEEAITVCQHAAAIFSEAGDEHRECIALGNVEGARAARLGQPRGEGG